MTGVWSCIRHAFCLDVAKNSPARADSTSSNQIWRLSRALETWPPGQIRVVKIMRSILNRTLLMERGSVHVWLGSSLAMHLIGRGSDGGCRKERLRAATWDPGAAGDNKVCMYSRPRPLRSQDGMLRGGKGPLTVNRVVVSVREARRLRKTEELCLERRRAPPAQRDATPFTHGFGWTRATQGSIHER